MRIDLHLHSTASDGSLSPSALAWAARAGGLDVIGVADHDTCAGVPEALAALPAQLHVVPAVELSTTLEGSELHILGYFVDHTDAGLAAHAARAIERRQQRVAQMLELLQKYSINVALEEVVAAAEGARVLGRPHVARALQRRGHVQTVTEAFDRFLGDQGPCFVPTDLLHPREAISLIAQAGGVALWAHPRSDLLVPLLPQLVEWGLRGLECYRPRVTASEIHEFEQRARRHGLLLSGGSDWHGSWHGKLGEFYVTGTEVGALLEIGGL